VRRQLVAGAAFAVALLGCSTDGTAEVEAGSDPAGASATVLDDGPVAFSLPVLEVAVGDTDRQLELLVGDLPAAGADGPCRYEIDPTIVEEKGDPFVRLRLTITMGHPYDRTFPSCDTAPVWVTADLANPLGDRDILGEDDLGNMQRWQNIDGTLTACVLPDCDPDTGAAPLEPTCDNGTLREAVQADDVPTHADITVLGCDGSWAVVDVDIGAGSCPAQDGPNPCAGERVDRLFWHAEGGAWVRVFWSRDPGCGKVRESVPAFPVALCEGLPAPPVPVG
jgi:hypothetical protein